MRRLCLPYIHVSEWSNSRKMLIEPILGGIEGDGRWDTRRRRCVARREHTSAYCNGLQKTDKAEPAARTRTAPPSKTWNVHFVVLLNGLPAGKHKTRHTIKIQITSVSTLPEQSVNRTSGLRK